MAKQNSLVHYTTPLEAAIMATIDQHVSSLQADEVLPSIDFPFLRDYTVMRIQTRLLQFGYRDYASQACTCVGASRYLLRNRHIATLNYKKITAVAK